MALPVLANDNVEISGQEGTTLTVRDLIVEQNNILVDLVKQFKMLNLTLTTFLKIDKKQDDSLAAKFREDEIEKTRQKTSFPSPANDSVQRQTKSGGSAIDGLKNFAQNLQQNSSGWISKIATGVLITYMLSDDFRSIVDSFVGKMFSSVSDLINSEKFKGVLAGAIDSLDWTNLLVTTIFGWKTGALYSAIKFFAEQVDDSILGGNLKDVMGDQWSAWFAGGGIFAAMFPATFWAALKAPFIAIGKAALTAVVAGQSIGSKTSKDIKNSARSTLSKVGKIGGIVTAGLFAISSALDDAGSEYEKSGSVGKSISAGLTGSEEGSLGAAGQKALEYGALGAAIGSVVPAVGTMVGGVIGAATGAILGYTGSNKVNMYIVEPIERMIKTLKDWFQNVFRTIKNKIFGITDFSTDSNLPQRPLTQEEQQIQIEQQAAEVQSMSVAQAKAQKSELTRHLAYLENQQSASPAINNRGQIDDVKKEIAQIDKIIQQKPIVVPSLAPTVSAGSGSAPSIVPRAPASPPPLPVTPSSRATGTMIADAAVTQVGGSTGSQSPVIVRGGDTVNNTTNNTNAGQSPGGHLGIMTRNFSDPIKDPLLAWM